MNRKRIFILLACAMAVIILFVVVTAVEVKALDQNTSDLAIRLKEAGVPLENATVTSRLPYKIEITLQSTSQNQKLTADDFWYILLAQHEATFAYRWGTRLNSFLLEVVNQQDAVIYSVETYLHPEDLNQVSLEAGTSSISDEASAEVVRNSLTPGRLTISNLDVGRGTSGQILLLTLTAASVEDANQSLDAFLGSFFKMLDTINQEQGTAIILCRLQLFDEDQAGLLNYVKDLESGYTQWSWDPGLSSEWFPQPPQDMTPLPILTSEWFPQPLLDVTPLPILPTVYPADSADGGENSSEDQSYP